MTNFLKLPTWADKAHVSVVIETPRGSSYKREFDEKLRVFTLAKPLTAGLTYPYDWGFIPSTRVEDGDPLDVLVIHDAGTHPGLVLQCKPIGILEVKENGKHKNKRERNDRLLAVPERSPVACDLQDVRQLPSRAKEELAHFFQATDAFEPKCLNFWVGVVPMTRARG
ncbi:inorganic diphosphatase [Bradyrhizobium neotropicale]|uniref:inorganic diphosphatase n=1 Tax=Bradyrhizobium neotropicale TaxID=1497615 RepID=UPI001FEDFC26|nr:inorganic diphosphatase [Bradyrhizobium neotropicale]